MSYAIRKTFSFSSGHSLPCLPDDHPCSRNHGHNYKATFVLGSADLDDHGMVQDFRELADVKAYIEGNLDHRDLNEVFPWMVTTSENIARHLYRWAVGAHPKLVAVIVSETDETSAEYRPS
jgi:6-pyruvoyltetrahydropterin/6-carboxytetrahydropterin synthase